MVRTWPRPHFLAFDAGVSQIFLWFELLCQKRPGCDSTRSNCVHVHRDTSPHARLLPDVSCHFQTLVAASTS